MAVDDVYLLVVAYRLHPVAGILPRFFRPPEFRIDGAQLTRLQERGYFVTSEWDFDTRDWEMEPHPGFIVDKLRFCLRRGGVFPSSHGSLVLMHEYPWTASVLGEFIDVLSSYNWSIAHPLELLDGPQRREHCKATCAVRSSHPWCSECAAPP